MILDYRLTKRITMEDRTSRSYLPFINATERNETMDKPFEKISLTKDNFEDIIGAMHAPNALFLNAECLFVEYQDIIKMPWYVLMSVIHQNEKLAPLINVNHIDGLDDIGLMEWYCQRSNRNPLIDIASAPLDKVDYDEILTVLMKNSPILYEVDTELNAVGVIKLALRQGIVKQVIIYSDEVNQVIVDDAYKLFGKNRVKVFCGNLPQVLERMPQDSSYMISDFNKIISIADAGKLDYASLILPYDYSYNFVIDEKRERTPIVDMTYLGKDHLFKYSYFNACYM